VSSTTSLWLGAEPVCSTPSAKHVEVSGQALRLADGNDVRSGGAG
jgi:hypothetical protein